MPPVARMVDVLVANLVTITVFDPASLKIANSHEYHWCPGHYPCYCHFLMLECSNTPKVTGIVRDDIHARHRGREKITRPGGRGEDLTNLHSNSIVNCYRLQKFHTSAASNQRRPRRCRVAVNCKSSERCRRRKAAQTTAGGERSECF